MHTPNTAAPGGYLDKKNRHPGLLSAAVVLHVGLLGTILSYHPEIVGLPEKPIRLIQIPPMTPPPPEQTPRKPRQELRSTDPRPVPRPETPTPRVTTIPTAQPWPEAPPQPPSEPGVGKGGAEITDPPAPPVLTSASGDPRFARDLQPPYPAALERLEVEGSVTVRVQIGTDGRVTALELIKSDDPAFFAVTRDWALKRWRFKPATRDGMAVTSWLTRTVHFRIVRDGNR